MKRRVKSLDDVPEALRSLYRKEGEWFVLILEEDDDGGGGGGGDDKELQKQLKAMRDNNIKLQKQMKEQEERYGKLKDLDPNNIDELLKFKEQVSQNEELKLLSEGKYDVVRSRWTENVKKQYETQLTNAQKAAKDAEEKANTYGQKLKRQFLDQSIISKFDDVGVAPAKGALRDILGRARDVFDTDEEIENIVAKDGTGDETGKEWTPESWITHLATVEAPHLFAGASGSGAGGSKKNNSGGKAVKWIDNTPEEVGKHNKGILEGTVKIRGLSE